MYYTKTITGNTTITTEINDESVFTRCPCCGREMRVDLQELFAAGDFDLCGTTLLCPECTQKEA